MPRSLERRGDVEEHELVRAGVGVRAAELDRVADVAEPDEVHALDDAAARDVEAGDQTRERHSDSRKRAPAAPLFSGWNCTPVNEPDSRDRDDALGRRRRTRRLGGVRVREVERVAGRFDLGPADARDAPFAQAHGAAGQDAEPCDAAVLLRLVECELQSQADAEDGAVGVDP